MSAVLRQACRWLCVWMLAVADPAVAADATRREALEAGKAYGATRRDTMLETVRQLSPEAVVPAYRGTAVPEVGYGRLGAGIEEEARLRLRDSVPGAHLYDSALGRPRFTLDPRQDPLLQRGGAISATPRRIIGALDDGYSGCTQVPAPSLPAVHVERRCTAWQARVRECEQELAPRCTARGPCAADGGALELRSVSHPDVLWEYHYPTLTVGNPAGELWTGPGDCGLSGGPRGYLRSVHFNLPHLARVEEFRLVRVHFEDHVRIRLNEQVVYGPPEFRFGSRQDCRLENPLLGCAAGGQSQGQVCRDRSTGGPCRPLLPCDCYARCCTTRWGVNGGTGNCERGLRQDTPDIDLMPYLQEGENVLEMQVLVSGTGRGWFQLSVKQACCTAWQDAWSSCAADADADCAVSPGDAVCLEDAAERVIEGERLHRDCWRRRMRYTCLGGEAYNEEDYCRELRAQGCMQTGSECMDTEQGVCTEYEQRYRCPPAPQAERTLIRCDERLYCLGEDCFTAGYRPSADFPLVASHLSLVEEAVRDMDPDSLGIFSGTAHKCKKTVLGFSNCCRDSGWGQDLGLARCSESERILGEQRAAGQCHYVGSYKTGSLFSRRRYQSFCCFRSRLGRMIQQQGRAQLGMAWGSARSPECRGYTPRELGSVDFERLDLSEFYDSALAGADRAARPEAAALGQRIEALLRERLPP